MNLAIKQWDKLSLGIPNSETYSIFRKYPLKLTRIIPNSIFMLPTFMGYQTRLLVGLSHLREHKFRHNFQDTINPLCSCSLEIASTPHFFLGCQNFITPRINLKNVFRKLHSNILNLDEISLTKLLWCGDSKDENKVNKKKLLAAINIVLSTKWFEDQLM